jgi:hypothetical protein
MDDMRLLILGGTRFVGHAVAELPDPWSLRGRLGAAVPGLAFLIGRRS